MKAQTERGKSSDRKFESGDRVQVFYRSVDGIGGTEFVAVPSLAAGKIAPRFGVSDGWVDAVDTVLYGWQTPQSLSDRHNKSCLSVYKCMIDSGVCEEQARMVLPASLMTEWYWSGSLDAFADMCRLRCKSDTQEETQEVAWDISLKMEELFPVSWVALRDE